MSRVMFSLPDKLIGRMKAVIPEGERSHVIADLLEKEIQAREQQFYERALQLESNAGLCAEMKEWDQAFGRDGINEL